MGNYAQSANPNSLCCKYQGLLDDVFLFNRFLTEEDVQYLYNNNNPTSRPSSLPQTHPSAQPSRQPTSQPSSRPTQQPTCDPALQISSSVPTSQPSNQPSRQPTSQPIARPTSQPSHSPTTQPTRVPSEAATSISDFQPDQTTDFFSFFATNKCSVTTAGHSPNWTAVDFAFFLAIITACH
jgi:outer membrane biosynthesis protein TonB